VVHGDHMDQSTRVTGELNMVTDRYDYKVLRKSNAVLRVAMRALKSTLYM
jgi:hypothetical protein